MTGHENRFKRCHNLIQLADRTLWQNTNMMNGRKILAARKSALAKKRINKPARRCHGTLTTTNPPNQLISGRNQFDRR